jgi:hypothetical protein
MPTTVNAAAITNGDLIPLLDDAGGGVYTAGRNNARDIRQGLLNLLAAGNGGPYTRRTGVIPSTYTGGAWTDLRVVGQGSPSTTVTIKAGQAIVSRTGEGYYLLSLTQDLNTVMTAANGSNPRWDRICIMGYDKGAFVGDAVHGPYIVIVYGDAAGSPTLPSIPTDAIEIARVLRAAGSPGDQIGSGSTPITDVRKSTSLHGGIRALLPGDALSDAGGYHGEHRFRQSGSTITAVSPVAELVDRWSATDSLWHGTKEIPFNRPSQTGAGLIPNGSTAALSTFGVPDLGFPYRLEADGGFEFFATDSGALVGCQITVNSAAVDTSATIARGLSKMPGTTGESKWVSAIPDPPNTTYTGATTVRLLVKVYSAPLDISVVNGGAFAFSVKAIPV